MSAAVEAEPEALGHLDALRVVQALRCTPNAAPGLLQAALEAVIEFNEPRRLLGFVRTLEKAVARPWGPLA